MIVEKNKLIHDMLIKHFVENNMEYIDKTDKGGAIYFFDEAASKELALKGYKVQYAQNGSKSTSGRAAWYIRME